MLSTDERVVVLYGVMHSIIRAFGLQQRLQNEREEEWFHLGGGRSGETSHHRDTSSSSLVRISSASMPCIRYQTTKTHQIEITYVAKRRVLLTTTSIHHRFAHTGRSTARALDAFPGLTFCVSVAKIPRLNSA